MNIFVITDTHIGHANLCKPEYDGRPIDFGEKVYDGLFALPSDAVLIHLGDVCFGNDAAVHDVFKGLNIKKRILLMGNHDNKSVSWYMRRWDSVSDWLMLRVFGKNILFSHRPVRHKTDEFDVNVHGHCHGNEHREIFGDWNKLCSSYVPVKLERILEI